MSLRTQRVGDLIREEVSWILGRRVKDPRIKMATITGVDVSPDLRNAKVFFSVLGDEVQWTSTQEGLAAAKPFIRRELSDRLRIRRVPDLVFVADRSLERAERIDRLLRGLD
ncbi:MAG: 30S ribosome-binding factor RbfA [Proteobacteria bacterium]|nr:30S ribosome-binding factor RbfA [Pseudomonadota bacterium]MBU1742530.1 30S ribosome-binding factor RbfA [Pseudomonadota bacterium]